MEERKNKILVPVDFSDVSIAATKHATLLAKKLHGELSLLHVIKKRFTFVGKKSRQEDQLIEEATVGRLQKIADEVERDSGIPTDIIALSGNIFELIPEVAAETKASFVVMGTHGMSGLQHIRGSNALRIIYQSSLPFLLCQEKEPLPGEYSDIVFPLDTNYESAQKTEWAVFLAQKFGSTIHVFYPNESDSFLKNKVKTNLNYVKNKFDANNVKYTLTLSERDNSTLAEDVNKFAKETNANLIIIMIYPSKGAGEFFLTPTTQKIITNEEQIPVICINPGNVFMLKSIIDVEG